MVKYLAEKTQILYLSSNLSAATKMLRQVSSKIGNPVSKNNSNTSNEDPRKAY